MVDEEKELAEKSKAESVVAEPPSEAPKTREDAPAEVGFKAALAAIESPVDPIFPDIVGEPEIAVPYSVSGAATVPQSSPSYVDLRIACLFSVLPP